MLSYPELILCSQSNQLVSESVTEKNDIKTFFYDNVTLLKSISYKKAQTDK
jgi:hypothetical protein